MMLNRYFLLVLLVLIYTIIVITLYSSFIFNSNTAVLNYLNIINIPRNDVTNNKQYTAPTENSRVFCIVKSYMKSFRNLRIQGIHKIWIRKCDEYRIIMMIPDELRTSEWKLGEEFEIQEPLKILQPAGLIIESHENITQKLYNSFISIYKRFPDFDWYYLVDDDAYVNVYNLKKFLSSKNRTELVTFGYCFNVSVKFSFIFTFFLFLVLENRLYIEK